MKTMQDSKFVETLKKAHELVIGNNGECLDLYLGFSDAQMKAVTELLFEWRDVGDEDLPDETLKEKLAMIVMDALLFGAMFARLREKDSLQ